MSLTFLSIFNQDSLAKEEEPLHVDLAEQNGAAQREAKVSNKKATSFRRQSLFLLSLSGHGDGEEVWWGKTEVSAEDKV